MDIKEIMEKLSEEKEKTRQLDNGYAYRNIKEYQERLASVLGTEHYTTEYRSVESLLLGEQLVISCVCRITILDEDFQPLFYKEGCGATEVSHYKQDKGGFVNLKGAYHVAETDAFKNACKALGVFGFEVEKEGKPSSNARANTSTSKATQTQGKPGENTERKYVNLACVTEEPFEIVRGDREKPVYKVSVAMYEDDKVNREKRAAIIFYPNRYAKVSEKLNSCIAKGEKNSIMLRLHVQVSGERNGIPQYIFDSFL